MFVVLKFGGVTFKGSMANKVTPGRVAVVGAGISGLSSAILLQVVHTSRPSMCTCVADTFCAFPWVHVKHGFGGRAWKTHIRFSCRMKSCFALLTYANGRESSFFCEVYVYYLLHCMNVFVLVCMCMVCVCVRAFVCICVCMLTYCICMYDNRGRDGR